MIIDWDEAFDNSAYVEDRQAILDNWTAKSRAARDALNVEADISYGNHPREELDIVWPEGTPRGLLVFVHGGYWHLLDKSFWTHLATGPLAHGWAVAIPSYPLAPDARIAKITASITAAIGFAAEKVDGPIHLAGHSAGGHLVARMMCEDGLSALWADRVQKVLSISPVTDLRPLLETKMNDTLRLDEAEAATESPTLLEPRKDVPVTFWVGAEERPEFLRQTRMIAEIWGLKGARATTHYDAGHHHFSVIDDLEFQGSPITRAICE